MKLDEVTISLDDLAYDEGSLPNRKSVDNADITTLGNACRYAAFETA